MYNFVRCQTHPKCPDLQGWYLVLKPGDLETLEELHRGISAFYFQKYGLDPHLKDEMLFLKHPVRLAAGWLETISKILVSGTTALVNFSGGILPPNGVTILSEITCEEMLWPDAFDPEEVITISRWPKGFHFYLTSSKDRVFVPPKYGSLEEALEVAELYTDNILEKL